MKSTESSNTVSSRMGTKAPIICKCGFECPIWTSKKPNSKGRSFFGCPLYKDKDKYCGFFQWCNEDSDQGIKSSHDLNTRTELESMKVALLEAKIGQLEAVKKMEIGEVNFQLKMKTKHIELLEFQLACCKFFIFLLVCGFVIILNR